MKNLVKFGNAKLPKSTMIFNMGTSKDCPARLLDMCSFASVCYARKPEILWPAVYPYRERQADKWLNTSAKDICSELAEMLGKKRKLPTLFRFNESGDFYGQKCIEKLDIIAKFLKKEFKIVTYGYTARKDLNFSNTSFLVKGSDNFAGNNGQTTVIATKNDKPKGFIICPGDCKKCNLCSKNKGLNIAFVKH